MTSPERSRIMRAVKGKNTTPEILVRRVLHQAGYRFRVHRNDLPGKPDIVFSRRQKVIFVHGCFWHGHDCARGARIPKTNTEYWKTKIARNKDRDISNDLELRARGWQVIQVWECETRNLPSLKTRLIDFLEKVAPVV